MSPRPTVVFICVSNGGKSQMAEALMRAQVGDAADIFSAGTDPKSDINHESAASVAAIGADMSSASPKGLDEVPLATADRVIILGGDAQVDPVPGMRADIERWDTDEPSRRGITGAARMAMIRDEIDQRVRNLVADLELS